MFHGPGVGTEDLSAVNPIDEAAILDFAYATFGQGYHSISSCKMSPSNDSKAVVDIVFKVHGVAGLRIADLGVCPVLTKYVHLLYS